MIPRQIHVVWVGDEALRPDNFIDSWRHHNPGFELRVWGNKDYNDYTWRLKPQMEILWNKELNGVADCMRWQILFDEGGFCVDADAECLRSLDDFLFEAETFTCWESELHAPGLLAAGYVAAQPGLNFFRELIDRVSIIPADRLKSAPAWQTVGPRLFTEEFHRQKYRALTIYPSHYFIPCHHFQPIDEYVGPGRVYAFQEWGSTRHNYTGLRSAAPRGASRTLFPCDYTVPAVVNTNPDAPQQPPLQAKREFDTKHGVWVPVIA